MTSVHNPNSVEVGMICYDIDGSLVLVDRYVDHKYVEVADWSSDHWSYEAGRVRMDELVPVGKG